MPSNFIFLKVSVYARFHFERVGIFGGRLSMEINVNCALLDRVTESSSFIAFCRFTYKFAHNFDAQVCA